jgi:hypothetical protein
MGWWLKSGGLAGKIRERFPDGARISPHGCLQSRVVGIKFKPLIPNDTLERADSMENFGSQGEYEGFCE